ncbi:long-chain-fatty-acid--CoA ligase [Novosphingobium sp. UBA1939]|uniref:long-chain-fatty-acid--CoA ligase n=1 Tax=Novosphingobium sp. UBA1939 TaxID=1946982 RepID=UPI0025E01F51|nr:long-chain-fatty-acid--CoA ligase [Novosphingobium sp. UBA1939]
MTYAPTHPDSAPSAATIPTVSGLIARQAEAAPDRTALKFEGESLSYASLADMVRRTAAALHADGVRGGHHIAYLGKNHPAYFVLLYAASRLGAVMVPVSWRLAEPEIEYILADTGATLLFADEEMAQTAASVGLRLPFLQKIATLPGGGRAAGLADYIEHVGAHHEVPPIDRPDTVFLQLYTSGTTGRPKGVMLTARNIFAMRVRCAEAGIEWDLWGDDEVALIAMPISHIGGTGYGLMSLYHGASGLVVREFSPEIVLESIREERVSKFFIVPTALQILVRHPEAQTTDFSRVRHILYGASPMPLPLLKEAIEVIGAGLVQQYGMTETAGTVVALGAEDHDPEGNRRMMSAGKALPGVEIRIVDDAGGILPAGAIGEILVRSDANMHGYWHLPEATAHTVDSENWLRTGDAGYLDDDGYLFICDRVKDMVCSGGENVYPAEVEAVLYGHPSVAEAAVIGVPDAKWGEAVKAIIVPTAGRAIDEAELIAFTRASLAAFKAPKSIDVVDALPRNASGKVLKKNLREPYWQGFDRRVN